MIDFSVILCTCNPGPALRQTLESLAAVHLPAGTRGELLLVDNSRDGAVLREVVGVCIGPWLLETLHEPQPGKSRALNRGVAASRGEVLLFTDDDVCVPPDWVQRMSQPLLAGIAEGVCGGVRLSEHCHRPWFTAEHRSWLAERVEVTDSHRAAPFLIGANMALHRRVFDAAGPFDEQLGPGALGFAEEALLALQMRVSGMRIVFRLEAMATHHPDPARLTRRHFLQMARANGRCAAYLMHHWAHEATHQPRRTLLKKIAGRWLARSRQLLTGQAGVSAKEMTRLKEAVTLLELRRIRRVPRRYSKLALRVGHLPHALSSTEAAVSLT